MKSKWAVVIAGMMAALWNTNAAPTTVVAWGDNTYGQTNVPSELTNVTAIAQGGMHGLALKSDSTVTAWGYNYTWTTPVTYEGQATVPVGLSNVTAIAAGYDSSLALKEDGSIVFWGDTAETNLPGGLSNIVAIASGNGQSVALRKDGVVIAWGNNSYGQTNVPKNLTNVIGIASGGPDTVALQEDGTVVVWGWNGYKQTNVPTSAMNVISVAEGLYHILALRGDGTVVAWGNNGYGQTTVPTGLTNVVAIAAGDMHSVALKNDGNVVAWGYNNAGQCTIPTGLSNVVAISGRRYQSLAMVNNGSPWILNQPRDQTVFSGMNTAFSVSTIGTTNVTYQWCFNGVNLPGATNASLLLTNVQTANSGGYSVILSNAGGVTISSNAVLAVNNSPPILPPSVGQIAVAVHSNWVMRATISGSLPQDYQWQFNGTNIAFATNAFLSLTNAQLTNSGIYSLVAANAYGSTTGVIATLTVMDLGAAVNATNLVWTSRGLYPWFPETSTNHDGIAAVQSGKAPHPQESILQTSVTGPGTLTFWAECSQFFDEYVFSTSGSFEQILFIPPPPFAEWVQETVYLGTGTQTLQWMFQGSPFTSPGLDAVWLDEVSFVAGATPAGITSISSDQIVSPATNVTFTVYAVGTPPLSYQWSFNGTLLPGATNFSFSLTNVQSTNEGVYAVTVTNAYGTPVVTNVSLQVQRPQFEASPANLFMSGQSFHFQLDGLTGYGSVIIFASTDLVTWLPIFTNPPGNGMLQFSDTNAAYLPSRFYRAASQK